MPATLIFGDASSAKLTQCTTSLVLRNNYRSTADVRDTADPGHDHAQDPDDVPLPGA